jgi:FtsP/CotA-like multicopper oxidase with cupredoxin domain
MGIIIGALMAAAVAAPPPAHYSFAIKRAEGSFYNPWTLKDDKVQLRSYVGSGAGPGDFLAPVIRVAPGQKLTVDLNNQLEPCTGKQPSGHACFNDTNLHTHGLWVSPTGNSDNVLVSIAPGETFRYEYDIPADHPAGTYWYHPHRHGNGYVQVGSGMAGALIVTGDRLPTTERPGDIDVILKDARGRPLTERIMVSQQVTYGCLNAKGIPAGKRNADNEPVQPFTCAAGDVGTIENFETDWGWPQTGRFTGLNGKVQPEFRGARAGAFERWRMINAGSGETMRMRLRRLDPSAPPLRTVRALDQSAWLTKYCTGAILPMWQIALDGLTRSEARKMDEAILAAGERVDMVVRFPEPGRYCIYNDRTRVARLKEDPTRIVALIDVEGAAVTSNPDESFRSMLVDAAQRAITDRAVRDRVVGDLNAGLKLSAFVWHKPVTNEEVVARREAILNVLDGPEDAAFRMNGHTYDHRRIDAVLPLGKAEEWQASSINEGHPLHIHVNPFQIIAIRDHEDRDLTDPTKPEYDPDYGGLIGQWKDTVVVKKNVRVTFRTRYERFTGDFVIHCHILFHGDHGMMQNLRIAAEGDGSETRPFGHH